MSVYKIPSQNLPALKAKFEKLGRRAKRLKLPAPTFTEIKVERIEEKDSSGAIKSVHLLHHITVDPGIAVVKVAGWRFVATIQHTEEGNIIRKVSKDFEIPNQYRNVTQLCEHCNTNRNRKDTYILFNEEKNTYKQVGRSCLRDFFGHDALLYAEQAQYLIDLDNVSEGYEEGFGSGGPHYDPLETYLSYVSEVIRFDGWMGRGKARDMGIEWRATADIAYNHMYPPKNFERLFLAPSEASVKEADAAIEWAANQEGEELSDYMHNIRTIARRMVCESRDMGLAASIVAAYQRHLRGLRNAELRAKRAEIAKYVGNIGDRLTLKLTVEYVTPCDSAWGLSHRHVMADADGNVFVWFAHGVTYGTGDELVLKGTVKKHSEWQGVKQNVLSRCERVEIKSYYSVIDGNVYKFEAASENEVKKLLREKLNIKRLPTGTKIIEDVPQEISEQRVAI